MVVALLSSLHFFLGKTGFRLVLVRCGKQKKISCRSMKKKVWSGLIGVNGWNQDLCWPLACLWHLSRGNSLPWIYSQIHLCRRILVGTNLTYRNKSLPEQVLRELREEI